MYAVKLVQVVSIIEIVSEIYKLYIFLGAERLKSLVSAEGLAVESICLIHPLEDTRHYDIT